MYKAVNKSLFFLMCLISLLCLNVFSPSLAISAKDGISKAVPGSMAEKFPKPKAAYDASKMGDMSGFNPDTWVPPTGDTIKIAIFAPYSGPASYNGDFTWAEAAWGAYDINQRGGIWVDGKKKLIQLLKADTMSREDQCRKVAERMVLKEKVHFFWGTPGSNMTKILSAVAAKYKIIHANAHGLSDDLQDQENFSRYQFMTGTNVSQVGRAIAYYYGQIRKKEKKFYILCQDYSFGREVAAGFKQGLKEHYPEAEIVGEDYHKLFLTDYAPYMTKIVASGAEVLFTGDWPPDSILLLKQARQYNINIPIANLYLDAPDVLRDVGVEGTRGLVHFNQIATPPPLFKDDGYKKFHKAWVKQYDDVWSKTTKFGNIAYKHGHGIAPFTMQFYWLLSVIERAKSTDPEKIIATWENDVYQYPNGKVVMMRACDHRAVQDYIVEEYVAPEDQKISYNIPPYFWHKECSYAGPGYLIPAAMVFPRIDPKSDRCKDKNGWGE
ncbi:MAG: ABC transporter substrate-binding protein [Pseudomonadota bacterium]|nr:ABC transporter substrate-binding protein [Pseudomonadota bacterium]